MLRLDNWDNRYPATGIQAYWGTDIDLMKKMTGLYCSWAFVSDCILEKEELEKRTAGLIRRHPGIRAAFFKNEEGIFQSVREYATFAVRTKDIREERAPDDIYHISGAQDAFLKKYNSDLIRELSFLAEKMTLYVSCFRISEKAAVYLFTMDHSVADGVSMYIIKNELLSGQIEEPEDGYLNFLNFFAHESSSPQTQLFWENQAAISSEICLHNTGKTGVDTAIEKIVLGTDTVRAMQAFCGKEGVSAVNLILYAYAKAVLNALDADKALFCLVSSGRHIPVNGIGQTVGCLLQELPVLLSREDSPRDFKRHYREAEKYSFAPPDVIWKTDRRNAFPLPLSLVFHEKESADYCKQYIINDYDSMPANSFIIQKEDGLHICLHRDISHFSVKEFSLLSNEMRCILLSFSRLDKPLTLQKLVTERLGMFRGIAVVCGEEALGYDTLESQVKRIASGLAFRGFGPGDTIIIKMHRSVRLVSALYGVFCSGSAAVPVNPDVPPERLKKIEASSGAKLVLTDEVFDALISDPLPLEILPIRIAQQEETALIIYTSGSTAEPKGICHTQHEEAVTFLQFPSDVNLAGLETGEYSSVISRSDFSYNLAYHVECPAPLLGKKLILLDENERNDAACTARRIKENPHAAVVFTPSLLEVFLENEAFHGALSGLSLLIMAGEPVSASLGKKLAAFPAETKLLSLYGSTECQSIGWSDLRSETAEAIPLPGADVRIIQEGKEAAAGETGEICICSDTASKTDIFGEALPYLMIGGRRYIRTGDAGVSTDGRHFKVSGRLDRCIKLHGLRINPSEIERHISRIPGVENCAVLLKSIGTQSNALTVYYTGAEDLSAKKLREWLADILPGYMIPTLCLHTDRIPLTVNGKTDYYALSEMPLSEKSLPTRHSHLTEKEMLTVKIAAGILDMAPSDFYPETELPGLGMDSIKVLSLVSQLQKKGWDLSLNSYYRDPSIRGIAGVLEPVKPFANTWSGYYAATPVQSYWAERAEADDRINGLYIFRIFIAGRVYSGETFAERMKQLAENHPALRSVFFRGENGKFVQKISPDANIHYEYRDIRYLRSPDDNDLLGRRQEGFLRAYAYQLGDRYLGADAAEEVSLHVSAITLDENASIFIILLNHCHADGMTERIILRELLATEVLHEEDGYRAYMAFVSEEENRAHAAAFWRQYLKDACPAFVPVRYGPEKSPAAAMKIAALNTGEARHFREGCKKTGVSVPMMINFLYGRALLDVLGEERIIFEVLLHGRNLHVKDPESTVGCLTERIPAVIGRKDGVKAFSQSLSEAERFGFIPVEDMFAAAWNKNVRPPITGAVVAEIDPINLGKCFCYEYNPIGRERLRHEHYLVDDDSGIRVIFHYDAAIQDESFYEKLTERMERSFREISGLPEQG